MNDLSEIENELKKLRPAQPSPVLFERIEEAIDEHSKASATVDTRSSWWRFTEQPYSWGFGLAAAAALILFAAISMERQQDGGKEIAQISPKAQTVPLMN